MSSALFDKFGKGAIQNRKERMIFLHFYSFTSLEYSIEDIGRKTIAQRHQQYPLCHLSINTDLPVPGLNQRAMGGRLMKTHRGERAA